MIKGMHHLAICSKNIKDSMRFYHDVLGWEITREVKGEDRDAYYVYIPGCGELEFVDCHGNQDVTPIDEYQARFHHFAVEVDDPEPYYKLLAKEGYKEAIPLCKLDEFGHYTCGFYDPDGIMIEFISSYNPKNLKG